MPKSRRKPPRALSLPRLVVPLGLGAALTLSAAGFVYFTRITLEIEAHFEPEAAHPWDGYAAFCLFAGMVAAAGLLLNRRDPAPMRWRRGRVRPAERTKHKTGKMRRRAGTMKTQ